MSSLDEANRFVNCVMNRTRHDTVMRGALVVLLAVLPLIALVYGLIILWMKDKTGDLSVFLTAVCFTFMFYAEMLVIFYIYRRSIDHSSRDKEWRSSLMDYAKECGCNVEGMASINYLIRQREDTSAEKPAILLIMLLFLFIMIFIGYPGVFNINTDSAKNVIVVLIVSIISAFLMFCFVLTYLIKIPYVHESLQVEFTEELSRSMGMIGVSVPTMPRAVKNMNVGLSVVLVIITLGLFIFVILGKTFTNTNYHIMNQWDYEVKLMEIIVKNEGGVGVMPNKAIAVRQ